MCTYRFLLSPSFFVWPKRTCAPTRTAAARPVGTLQGFRLGGTDCSCRVAWGSTDQLWQSFGGLGCSWRAPCCAVAPPSRGGLGGAWRGGLGGG
eukprot:3223288-Prymnesium_polylepis.1